MVGSLGGAGAEERSGGGGALEVPGLGWWEQPVRRIAARRQAGRREVMVMASM